MTDNHAAFVELTAEVVAAYVTHNSVRPGDMPDLLVSVHATLTGLSEAPALAARPATLIPPVSIRKSVTDDYLVSLEDGKQYQSLKRHLSTRGLTPAEYRVKWGLPHDYPMVAPSYARKRSDLAKSLGLGNKRRNTVAASPPPPAEVPEKRKAGRRKRE